MKVRGAFFCAALVLGFASSTNLMGQDIGIGVAQGNLTLRESPPSGLFFRRGDDIGTVPKDSTVTVVERRDIPILFGVQEWLLIQRTGENGQTQKGWLYNGNNEQGTAPYVRLERRS